MLSTRFHREQSETLLIDRNKFPIQIEAGNPFMVPQEYEFLKDRILQKLSLEAINIASEADSYVAQFRSKQIELASTRLNKRPDNPQLLNNLGVSYLNNGQYDSAISCFKKAFEYNTSFIPALGNLAKAYFSKGELDEALSTYRSIEKIEPQNVSVLNNIAIVLFGKGDYQEAEQYLKHVMCVDKDNITALNNIATIRLRENNLEEAIHYLRGALSIKNDLPGVLNNHGVCFAIKRSYKKAIKHFLASRHLNKQAVGPLSNLAQAYQEIDAHDKAIEVLTGYIESGSDDKRIRDALSWSYACKRDYKNC
ncbi:tetratricopeptide repeat protein, partial [bacterium]|nr:tetratricopeptide repeat protein [bacterium]